MTTRESNSKIPFAGSKPRWKRLCVVTAVALMVATSCRSDDADEPVAARAAIGGCDPQISCPASEVIGLDLGDNFSCALRYDGRVRCWGLNSSGQLGDGTTTGRSREVEVLGVTAATRLNAGALHACAIDTARGAVCWGSNAYGQLGDGTTASSSTPRTVSTSVRFTDVAAGDQHSCAVAGDGSVFCWGNNALGQLGDGTTAQRLVPTRASVTGAASVVVGVSHSCALLLTGGVRCWGNNALGQLGDGTTTARTAPVAVVGISTAVELAAGSFHTCARLADGTVRCWGNNGSAQLGDGTYTLRSAPVTVVGVANASRLGSGREHTCASSDADPAQGGAKSVWCWGRNASGQLGDGTTTSRTSPARQANGFAIERLSGGASHTCSLDRDGQVLCWGSNASGQFGNGTTTSASRATLSTGAAQAISLEQSDGTSRTRLIAFNGAVMSFRKAVEPSGLYFNPSSSTDGDIVSNVYPNPLFPSATVQVTNTYFRPLVRLADGTVWQGSSDNDEGSLTFSPVAGVTNVTQLWGAFLGWCARRANGTALCGNGTTMETPPISNVASMALGTASTPTGEGPWYCALSVGSVLCWGSHTDGTRTSASSPVRVSALGFATQIAGGGRRACALLLDGTVSCWDPTIVGSVPTSVSGVASAVEITVGGNHGGARISDGTVRCWGDNSWGQRGIGHFVSATATATTVSFLDRVAQVRASANHTCALRVDGGVRCWGQGSYVTSGGRTFFLGDGSALRRQTAVPVRGARSIAYVTLSTDMGPLAAPWFITATGQLQHVGLNETGHGPLNATGYPAMRHFASSGSHQCGASATGAVLCEGSNDAGQIGVGGTSTREPVRTVTGLTGATMTAVGRSHSCALTGSDVWCWGSNGLGQVGDATTTQRNAPVRVLTGAASVSAYGDRTCALLSTGRVRCWGDSYGVTPTEPSAMVGLSALSVHAGTPSCAVLSNRTVRCWGADAPDPTLLAGFQSVDRFAQGRGQMCAVRLDGVVSCRSATGAIRALSGVTGAANVAINLQAIVVTLRDGTLMSVGSNDVEYLGDGSASFAVFPRPIVYGG